MPQIKRQTQNALLSMAIKVNIIREEKIVLTAPGAKGSENGKPLFHFLPEVDIRAGDIVEEPITNTRFYVSDVDILAGFHEVIAKKAFYTTNPEKSSDSRVSNTFNIQNASNSIIGTQASATINVGTSIADFRQLIEERGGTDKNALSDIADILEEHVKNEEPIKKGMLSTFSDVLAKHSWAFDCVAQIVAAFIAG